MAAHPGLTKIGFMIAACIAAGRLVASPSTWAACTGPAPLEARIRAQPDADSYARLAAWFDRNHRPQCALKAWSAALQIDPASAPALDGQARSMLALGDYASVIRNLKGAAHSEALILDLAIAYRKSGMLEDDEQTLLQGLTTFPDADSLTAALVALDVDESHYEVATRLADKIAADKPGDLEAQRILLRTLVITGDTDRAVPLGRKLLAGAPRDPDLLNLNGLLEKKAGDYQAARKHLQYAVALNPNDYNPRVNLGVVLAALNDLAGAKLQLEKALALGTDEAQVHFELAKVERSLGETDAARRQLEIYQLKLKHESDRAVAVSRSAEAAQAARAGDNLKAAELYQEACAAEPQDAGLAYQLALVLDKLNDRAGERAALEQAIRANPHFVLAQYQLGYMDFQAGDNAAAERRFRLTVAEVPDNTQAWISLAAALATQSRFAEAQNAVEHALKLDPQNAAALSLSRKLAEDRKQH